MTASALPHRIVAETPIQYLKGVGPAVAELLNRKGIATVSDLLFDLPVKYLDRGAVHKPGDLHIAPAQTCVATIQAYAVRPIGRGRRMLEITLADPSGFLRVTMFRFNEAALKKKYPPGTTLACFGDVKMYRGIKTMVHPEFELWEGDEDYVGGILPFYSLTEGLRQKTLRRIYAVNRESLLSVIDDDPRSVREDGHVKISLQDAFTALHYPEPGSDVDVLNAGASPFHQRIAYDEFFYLQLGLLTKRYREARQEGVEIAPQGDLLREATALLPFKLTTAQKNAIEEVRQDFASGRPMNRLLQGDVGSGKTVVAFLSALIAIEAGFQAVLMAPTEILAEQHFRNFLRFENALGVRGDLLTGSTSAKSRQRILAGLASGETPFVMGTHALIESDVVFRNLGFVVIDEQHRFGVAQRAKLRGKAKRGADEVFPHVLVMTATPIPRTLSMTLYGDLDVTIMNERPAGRQPIETKVFRETGRERLYKKVASELSHGRQAYFIYPLVEESEKSADLKDATRMRNELALAFPDFVVGLLHGRMSAEEKEQVMARFKSGEFHILAATTVVEVGVDVPNATVMVVEHAERFGLSQLHQLRGRVGRGSEQSYCYLMAGYAQSEESRFRLNVMESTDDGFVIAEEDLKLRGPGDFLGTKQAGLPDFRLASLVRDGHLLTAAKRRAEEVLSDDHELQLSKNLRLRKILLDRWGRRLDLVTA